MTATHEVTGEDAWSRPGFRAAALAWVDDQLGRNGVRRVGEPDERIRNWSSVWKVPTDDGQVWFKAEGVGQAFEAKLYPVLQRLVPRHVLHPLAVDLERHWLLLPDGGPILRSVVGEDAERLVDAMVAFLPEYAQLQLDLVPHVDELLTVGVADMTPAVMPRRFDEAVQVAGTAIESVPLPDPAADTLRRVVAGRGRFVERCEILAAGQVPVTLQHDDLHHGNVFAHEPGAPMTFFDWGDAVVAHPFATLLFTLRVLRELVDVSTDDPVVRRVRDAYLEPFSAYASHRELVALVEHACHVGKVTRALTWARELRTMPPAQVLTWAPAQLGWLAALLVDDYLGSRPDAD